MSLDILATKAADLMMRGAVKFLRARGLDSQSIDTDALIIELRARAPGAVQAALRDAKEALEAPGLDRFAEATFAATMSLAGIEAAKAVLAAGAE